MKRNVLEKLLWSIALPGFGQLLNGKYVKGLFFIILEVIINVQANFNRAILLSFNGEIQAAIEMTNFQWLMFYPCLYFFTIWDAYRDAQGGEHPPFLYLPFVFAAYTVTVGLMYSPTIRIFGVLFGPVFLPMLFMIPGLIIGFILKKILSIVSVKEQY